MAGKWLDLVPTVVIGVQRVYFNVEVLFIVLWEFTLDNDHPMQVPPTPSFLILVVIQIFGCGRGRT